MRKLHFLMVLLLSMVGLTAMADDFEVSDAPTSEGWAAKTYWYYIQNGYTDDAHPKKGYLCVSDDYVYSGKGLHTENETKPDDNGLWCIVGNDTDGYQFYNKAKGTGYVLGLSGTEANAWLNMYETSTTDETVTLKFDKAASNKVTGCYCFKLHGTDNDWLNNRDDGDNDAPVHIGLWSNANSGPSDNGSSILFTDPMSEYKTLLSVWNQLPEGTVGAPTATQKENMQTACNNSDASSAETVLTDVGTNTLEVTEGYYRILNSQRLTEGEKAYLAPNKAGTGIVKKTDSAKALYNVVKIAKSGEYYTFYINGKWVSTVPTSNNTQWSLTEDETAAGKFSFEYIAKTGAVNIKEQTTADYQYLHDNNPEKNDENKVVRWEAASAGYDAASNWFLVKATEAEITLNAATVAGQSGYVGTVYTSFDATLPSTGSVLTSPMVFLGGTDNGSSISFTQGTGVPAGQGVIIASLAASTVTLNISDESVSGTSTLSGTYSDITLDDTNRSNYLVLGRKKTDTSVLGFFKASSSTATITRNKAYYDNSGASEVMALDIDFGQLTSIDNAVKEAISAQGAIYDLSGRRVLAPVKGGIYIQNGKKFVK